MLYIFSTTLLHFSLKYIVSYYMYLNHKQQSRRLPVCFLFYQALNTTNMWVLTNGLDGGISRIVGDAIHNEHERRSILLSRANTAYGKITHSAHVEELTKLTVIGVVPKSALTYGADIATNVSTSHVLNGMDLSKRDT